ncbi:MAG: tyrosine-type recombinase/integrase [Thermodesulfobacteriota bacterium]
MASLYQDKGVWFAIFTVNYKQKWIKIGKMSKTAAKEALRKLEERHEKKKHGLFDDTKISFKDYSNEYLEFSKSNKAENSYKRDITTLKNLASYFGTKPLSQITSHHIEKYKMMRLEEVAPRTVNIELRCLSHMFNKAVEWEYISDSPYKGIRQLTFQKKPPRFLAKDEVQKLLDHASNWLRPILVVMLNTGIREGERTKLRFKDIDFNKNRILIHSPKTKSYRAIPMNKEVKETLLRLKDNFISLNSYVTSERKPHQKEYVFCNEDGSPVLKIKKALANACKKAGLKGVTPHTLRHTFASHLVMSGVDLNTVQRLLGHTSISTTLIYSHLTEDHLARGVERLNWDNTSN